jgi:hypothetical protein
MHQIEGSKPKAVVPAWETLKQKGLVNINIPLPHYELAKQICSEMSYLTHVN